MQIRRQRRLFGTRRRVLGALLVTMLAVMAAPAAVGHGATRRRAAAPVVVLTGTTFPAGLGIGVAADPSGLQQALWSPLVGFDDRQQPYAGLAARVPTLANGDVQIKGGGMTVTIHLKPGLRFSDGSPLTAADVVFGLLVNLDPALGNSFGFDEIAHYATPDTHTVVLQFHDLYGAYLAYALPPALPKAYVIRKYGARDIHALALAYRHDPYDSPSDVFSGPYKVASLALGQRLTLAPNPYFTALPARGPRPELRYTVLSYSEAALAQALRAPHNGVDLALGFGPAALPALRGLAGGLHARTLPSYAVEHLELNQATPVLKDLRVRQALQLALDKRAFARALFPASINPARYVATSLLPSASPYHDRGIAVSAYGPARARALLQAAGYATSLGGPGKHVSLTLVTTNDPTRQREADLLAAAWAAIGVRATPRLVSASPSDQGGLYAPYDRGGALAARSFDVALFDLRLGPDPATVASLFDPARVPTPLSQGERRRNYTGIANDAIATLPEAAQASLDFASRKRGYAKVQREANALLPYIVLYERPRIVVDDGHVAALRPAPQEGGELWNVWQWTRR